MKRPDYIDLSSKTLGRIVSNPYTWAPYLPIAAAYAFFGAPYWICLCLAGLVGFGTYLFWKRQWPRLYEKTKVDTLESFLEKENDTLEELIQELRTAPPGKVKDLQNTLSSVHQLKKSIENKIFSDRIITTAEQDVSKLVSQLTLTMCHEVRHILALRLQGKSSLQPQIDHALQALEEAQSTLNKTYEQLETIINPVMPEAANNSRSQIESVQSKLQDRIEHATAIRDMVQSSLNHQQLDQLERNVYGNDSKTDNSLTETN
ncbi:MAG: hypothetical protein AAGA18_10940 [Verrucomicrobiota bacterium]